MRETFNNAGLLGPLTVVCDYLPPPYSPIAIFQPAQARWARGKVMDYYSSDEAKGKASRKLQVSGRVSALSRVTQYVDDSLESNVTNSRPIIANVRRVSSLRLLWGGVAITRMVVSRSIENHQIRGTPAFRASPTDQLMGTLLLSCVPFVSHVANHG